MTYLKSNILLVYGYFVILLLPSAFFKDLIEISVQTFDIVVEVMLSIGMVGGDTLWEIYDCQISHPINEDIELIEISMNEPPRTESLSHSQRTQKELLNGAVLPDFLDIV